LAEIASARFTNESMREALRPYHLKGGVPSMYIEENEQGAYLRGDSRPALARMQIMSKSPEIARA